jgi:hypothetical protein
LAVARLLFLRTGNYNPKYAFCVIYVVVRSKSRRKGILVLDDSLPGDDLLIAVEELGAAHDRHEAERSDATSSQNSLGDDGENRDLNLPRR